MISTKEKVIDGHTILVTQYAGRRAFEYKARLFKLMGSSIARLFTGTQQFNQEAFAPAVDALIENIEPKALVDFLLELFCSTRIDGKEITGEVFDMEFAGNMTLMYKILWFTLEVNYGSFFGGAGIGKILSKLKETTPAPVPATELKRSVKR
jgi:hypothetical protein